MRLNGRIMDLARAGAEVRIAELQAQIDELQAQFPGLGTGAPRRRRRTTTPTRRHTHHNNRTRKPGSGEVKAFVLEHGDLSAHQAEEARRLQALLAEEGITTNANVVAATLSRVRRQQETAHDKA